MGMLTRDVSRRVSRRRDTSPRCSTFAGWLLAAVGGICIMAHLFQKALMNLAQQYIVKSLASSPAFQQFALRTVNYAKSLEAQVMRTVSGQRTVSASHTAAAQSAGRAQQRTQPHQQQQQHRQAGSAGRSVFLHRAQAFVAALKEEASKDFGGAPKRP